MRKCIYSSSFLFMLLIGIVVFFLSEQAGAKNLILNGEFDDGLNHWDQGWINFAGGVEVEISINNEGLLSGENCMMLEIGNPGINTWDIQRMQILPMVAGAYYSVTFMAMFEGSFDSVQVFFAFEHNEDPWDKYIYHSVMLYDVPTEYGHYEYTADVDDDNSYLKYFLGATEDIIIYLDAIVVDDGEPETAVNPSEGATVPTAFDLRQNFPNPFNPTTQIQYSIAEANHVRLAVYDVHGKEVARIVDKQQAAGSYTVSFSAQGLPSGTYFYRLDAGHFTATKKMVVLR
ncbi:hypothetical protein A2V82_11665 [candidate division KSB1 bacterium RBG_16_48_16]|nr:MAG: hypothetical protein A2V82_11665 [candidate division KSB1 bacterium RBG_16_48_16]